MKILIFFDNNGNESASFEIPPFYVKCGLDYAYILWKYGKFHKKNPTTFDSWDTVKINNNAENN
jgi:hypothetical protein